MKVLLFFGPASHQANSKEVFRESLEDEEEPNFPIPAPRPESRRCLLQESRVGVPVPKEVEVPTPWMGRTKPPP